VSADTTFSAKVEGRNAGFKATDPGTDTAPTVDIYFAGGIEVSRLTMTYVNGFVAPSTGDAIFDLRADIDGAKIIKGRLEIGHSSVLSLGHRLHRIEFVNSGTRHLTALTLVNASLTSIKGMRCQEYQIGISIAPTHSFSAFGIEIDDPWIVNAQVGIAATGSSVKRITGLRIRGGNITGSSRDAGSLSYGSIRIAFGVDVEILNFSSSHPSDVIRMQGVLGARIEGCQLTNGNSAFNQIRMSGCQDIFIKKNRFFRGDTDGYPIIALAPSANQIVASGYYASRNIIVEDNDFWIGPNCRGIGFNATDLAQAVRNRFYCTTAPSSNGFIRFNGDATRGYFYDNMFFAPSGTPVVIGSGGDATGTRPDDTIITTTTSAVSVTEPVITATDTDLDNAKSYVSVFTLGHVTQLRQLVDDDDPKTLSTWMGTVTGETLGWNSSAWGTTEDVSDIVSQGAMRDNFLVEDNLTARDAMVIIDRHGRLTCRDFNYSNSAQQSVLMYVGGQAIAERAWVSATFRPPLVVDGALFDVVGAGYLTQSQYDTQLSARQGLGQKSDGTFVLLTVDGATDVSGTTVKKQAEKMLALGCVDAFALDTGGSVTLWYDGEVINSPSDVGGERDVPAVMYV
jgi:hypothetical protein